MPVYAKEEWKAEESGELIVQLSNEKGDIALYLDDGDLLPVEWYLTLQDFKSLCKMFLRFDESVSGGGS